MKTIDKLSDEEIKPNAKKVMQVMRNTFTGGQGFYDPVKKQVSKKQSVVKNYGDITS